MTVYLSHATSFCGGVWRPVMSRLGDLETVAWDQPGHGSGAQLSPPFGWETFGEHVLEITDPGGIGVGHSMGAAALVMAQIADPSRFRALVLIEPVMFPGPFVKRDNEMSGVALRRRTEFDSRAEAAESFRGRGAFTGWDEDAFMGYIDCGLTGDGPVRLACDPEVEAEIYRGSGAHRTWERAGEIDIPVLLMSGRLSGTIDPELARAQAALLGGAGLEVVDGAGHFLPMERPALIADRVRRLAETVLG